MKLLEKKRVDVDLPNVEDLPFGTVFTDADGDIFLRTEDGIVALSLGEQ